MKVKILQALKTKYSNLGLDDKVFDGVSDILQKTITEETQIEDAVNGAELLCKSIQGAADKARGDKATMQKELDELKKQLEGKAPEKKDDATPKDGDMPEWAKQMLENQNKQIETLQSSIQTIQTGTISKTRQSKLDEALKGAPPEYTESIVSALGDLGGFEDADFEARLATIQTKGRVLAAKNGAHVPGSGGSYVRGDASNEECEDIVNQIMK